MRHLPCRTRRAVSGPAAGAVKITDPEAARFLLQAQFAVTDADLAAVKTSG